MPRPSQTPNGYTNCRPRNGGTAATSDTTPLKPGLCSEKKAGSLKDFLLTVKNSCTIHTLDIAISIRTEDDLLALRLLSEPSCSLTSLSLTLNLLGTELELMKETMAVLKENPALCSLTIRPDTLLYDHGDALAMAISDVRFSASIRTLDIDLDFTKLTKNDVVFLSQLRDSPTLCALTLSLCGGDLDDLATESLLTLRDAPVMQSLCLTLDCITNTMVCHIAKVLQSNTLRKLPINLMIDQFDEPIVDTTLCEIFR